MLVITIIFLSLFHLGSCRNACEKVGGTCRWKHQHGGQIRVRGKGVFCPGPRNYVCYTDDPTIDAIDRHIASVEQFWVTGYVPTSGSGVTIASGYDIGHGTRLSTCLSTSLWQKLSPYTCCKNRVSLTRKGLHSFLIHWASRLKMRGN